MQGRKIILPLMSAAILAAAAAGCKPVTGYPPAAEGGLVDKITDRPAAIVLSSAQPASTGAAPEPRRFKDRFADDKLAVIIDAALELPPVENLSVAKVAPRKFTQSDLDRMIEVLFQGNPAYLPKETQSKADIKRQIAGMNALKARMEKGDKSGVKIDRTIEYLEKQLKTAPERVKLKTSSGEFNTDELGGQEIYVISPLNGQNDAVLSVYCSGTSRTCSVWFTNANEYLGYTGYVRELSGTARGVDMPPAKAEALAIQTVEGLGSDLKLAARGISSAGGMGMSPTDADAPQAYFFAFAREVNGVSTTYEGDIGAYVPKDEMESRGKNYAEPHPYERIIMAIDDSGILELQWTSPDKITEILSTGAQTLSFGEIMQIFENQFFVRNALTDGKGFEADPRKGGGGIGYGEDILACAYTIDRITLGLTRIAAKDGKDEFMIVPAWDFFGSLKVQYTAESGLADFDSSDRFKSFLTINAIDGSVIDRSCGY